MVYVIVWSKAPALALVYVILQIQALQLQGIYKCDSFVRKSITSIVSAPSGHANEITCCSWSIICGSFSIHITWHILRAGQFLFSFSFSFFKVLRLDFFFFFNKVSVLNSCMWFFTLFNTSINFCCVKPAWIWWTLAESNMCRGILVDCRLGKNVFPLS